METSSAASARSKASRRSAVHTSTVEESFTCPFLPLSDRFSHSGDDGASVWSVSNLKIDVLPDGLCSNGIGSTRQSLDGGYAPYVDQCVAQDDWRGVCGAGGVDSVREPMVLRRREADVDI